MRNANIFSSIDYSIFSIVLALYLISVLTTIPFNADNYDGFLKHCVTILLSLGAIVLFANFRLDFLKSKGTVVWLYVFSVLVLMALAIFADPINSARSWFVFFDISIQPVDFVKVFLIIIMAQYFSKRHIHIFHIRNILIPIVLVSVLFLLTLAQPDFGSAMVLGILLLGFFLISGVSKKHLSLLIFSGIVVALVLWQFAPDYQKVRISSFLNPTADAQGAGYNAIQAQIAIGSGQIFGKGIGEGTQSRLNFLPEYKSDFIFSAFAEEWGLVGVILLFILYYLLLARLIRMGSTGRTDFGSFFIFGTAILIFAHFCIHVGVNLGVLPVTGITLPFLSYGGSHLLSTAIALGMSMSLYNNKWRTVREDLSRSISESL